MKADIEEQCPKVLLWNAIECWFRLESAAGEPAI